MSGPTSSNSQACQTCATTSQKTFTCIQCNNLAFCDACWPKWVLHTPGSVGWNGKPHERSDPVVLHRLRQILEPNRTEAQHEAELLEDEDTSWFGFGRDPTGQSIFHDYGRFSTIMAESLTMDIPERFPQLASFIGETGAGKSTVIKLLIDRQDMTSTGESKFYSPVTSSNHDRIPTTGDVHLYADPATLYTPAPLLLVDSEGFNGGEAAPKQLRNRSEEFAKGYKSCSSRRITWAKTPNTKKREYAVSQLYPRILYTFSDVVVFVLRNARAFESTVLPKLLRWGAASIDKSLNQPVLPHAIIVLNATEVSIDEKEWDVATATEMLMSDTAGAVHREPALQEYVQQWRQRGREIASTKELLECYYASISVVRVPYKGSYMLMNEQAGKLADLIKVRAAQSHQRKRRVRMLATPEKLQFYLQAAFDHFTKDLDTPFDFIKETLRHNPVSRNFEGSILNLALAIRDHTSNTKIKNSARQIFRAMVPIIASCVMFDTVRQNLLGTASRLLEDRYSKPCSAALQTFSDMHWPCTFVNHSYPGELSRCCNVRSGHNPKGHQNIQGKIIGNGDYISDMDPAEFAPVWTQLIRASLIQLQSSAFRLGQEFTNMSELQVAAILHRERLNEQYSSMLGAATDFVSYSSCLCCLRELPECALPCGHVLCLPCVQVYGTRTSKTTIEISRCPLHVRDVIASPPWVIFTKPQHAGTRTLCLDGGGVRGIVQLQVLRQMERMLGPDLPIQLFFDLIVGTSTGGIIAIGLGAKKWTVDATIQKFKDLCREGFVPHEMSGIPLIGMLSNLYHGSLYKTQPLQMALRRYLSDQPFFGASTHRSLFDISVKVAVTATTAMERQPVVFANYNRPDPSDKIHPLELPYQFARSDVPSKEIRMWEAARATSATAPFFKAFLKEETNHEYVDGGAQTCPIWVCHHEAKAIWSDVANSAPDLMLSLGSGRNVGDHGVGMSSARSVTNASSSVAPGANPVLKQGRGGVQAGGSQRRAAAASHLPASSAASVRAATAASGGTTGYFVRDPRTPLLISLNNPHAHAQKPHDDHRQADRIWARYLADKESGAATSDNHASRYVRINPELFSELPKFTDVSKIDDLERETEEVLRQDPGMVIEAVHRLLASTFFFERDSGSLKETESSFTCTGSIYCRFRQGSAEMRALGWLLTSISSYHGCGADFDPYFLLEENGAMRLPARRIVLTSASLQDMHYRGHFELQPLRISTVDETTEVGLSLCLQPAAYQSGATTLPISGFPRRVMADAHAVGTGVLGQIGGLIPPPSSHHSVIERQCTGSSSLSSSAPVVSSPESIAASLVSSATSIDSPQYKFSNLSLRENPDFPVELPGSTPAAELDGHHFSSTVEVRMKI
ncbi:hypothetical protein BX600DRAFT_430886 [Xylariales sp. PMI_506]|nr:hypothetical protein BX600DRAFT_430886 [Xylariales sp. PMI_506]